MVHLELQLLKKNLYIKMIEFESDKSEIKVAPSTGAQETLLPMWEQCFMLEEKFRSICCNF